jgi:hypothetical protein
LRFDSIKGLEEKTIRILDIKKMFEAMRDCT